MGEFLKVRCKPGGAPTNIPQRLPGIVVGVWGAVDGHAVNYRSSANNASHADPEGLIIEKWLRSAGDVPPVRLVKIPYVVGDAG